MIKFVKKVGLFLLLALPLLTHAEPIHDAVRNGNVQQVKQLLAGDAAMATVTDAQGFNAMAIALTMNNADICKVLLDSGANPNQRLLPIVTDTVNAKQPRNETTALHLFAASPLETPDVNDKDALARYILARDARVVCLKLLLAAKADMTSRDAAGNTPLHIAILAANDTHANLEIIMPLTSKETINLPGNHGETPLADAIRVQQYDITKILISRGANVNHADIDGVTPLHQAVTARNLRLIEILLDNKADPTLADKAGKTARQLADEEQDAAIVKLFNIK